MKQIEEMIPKRRFHTNEYLGMLGIRPMPPLSSPSDAGVDPLTFESHLEQSASLISAVKFSMGSWLVGGESAARQKIASARRYKIPIVTGATPFEIAFLVHRLSDYLDLCADMGITRIECGFRIADKTLQPEAIVRSAAERDLQVQYELRRQPTGLSLWNAVDSLIDDGKEWLEAGAVQLIIKAFEGTCRTGLFNFGGDLNRNYADRFAETFGLHTVAFEAPNVQSQFELMDHFGSDVHLCDVKFEDILSVESYRRKLHFASFIKQHFLSQAAEDRQAADIFEFEAAKTSGGAASS